MGARRTGAKRQTPLRTQYVWVWPNMAEQALVVDAERLAPGSRASSSTSDHILLLPQYATHPLEVKGVMVNVYISSVPKCLLFTRSAIKLPLYGGRLSNHRQ